MDALADKIHSPVAAPAPPASRLEELGRIILAYSDVTEKLQRSHAQLQQTVQSLRNELSEKNRQLERKQRLAALGEMAAGIAHEIRNPLGAIQLYTSMLCRDLVAMPPSLQLVNKISAGVKRLDGLVGLVLQFTREIEAHPVETDLADLVDQAVETASHTQNSEHISWQIDGPRPLAARLDPLLMGQALLNLLLNAIQAMDGAGTITVSWSNIEEPGQPLRIRLTVRDTGPGIEAAALERIFNPFFTTKETGTGLGLSIVHRVVEAHDGTIAVTNSPSGGAHFEIKI